MSFRNKNSNYFKYFDNNMLGKLQLFQRGSMTPGSRDYLNRIKVEGASYGAQFNNSEAGMPSGPAA